MSNYQTGHDAEKIAAEYLTAQKFMVRSLNWKTRVCEIDIIAEKNRVMYFVEVKYRKNVFQGRALEYITPKKLKQMRFAAEIWVNENKWRGEYCLAAIAIDGSEITFLDELHV